MAAATSSTVAPQFALASSSRQIAAVLFDAFPVFDPRPIFAAAEEVFPGRGNDLGELWRDRQFEYTWLRSLGGRYQDFWQVTESALVFAAESLKLDLTPEKSDRLMKGYLKLKAWPEVPGVLKALRERGIRLAFLSNFTPHMLDSCIQHSGLQGMFDHLLSTDAVKTYKPDPRAYRMGTDVFNLRREQMAFVAFAGWDAVGAKWFGYPTFWANRRNQPVAEMGVLPDASGGNLSTLIDFVRP